MTRNEAEIDLGL